MSETRNSSLLGKITVLVVICCCSLSAQGKYGGGSGTAANPYLIYTAEQMNAIGADSNDWDKHFLLCADIDLSAYTGTQFNVIGRFEGWSPTDKPFSGVFDGNNHKICNFTWISTDGRNQIGLFVFLGEGGLIKNLTLENGNINAANSYYVGSLVGLNYRGTVQACRATGCVTAYHSVGGLVGHNYYKGTIKGCSSATNVSGQRSVGGLAGENYYGAITDCNSTGSVTGDRGVGGLVGKLVGIGVPGTIIKDCYSTATVSGKDDVGGLVGSNEWEITDCYATGRVTGQGWGTGGLVGSNGRDGTITNCYSTGLVSGNWFTSGLAGSNGGKITKCRSTSSVCGTSRYSSGLVGANYGIMTACYSTGPVSGTANVSGGLVGKNENGTISNCYSTSSVDANDYVGGLLGSNLDGIIINSYCTGEVTGNLYVGGLLGVGGGTINCFWDIETSGQPSSDGGTGKTTTEMKTASTFFGWNGCGEILWNIDEGNDYPRLLWEGTPGQVLPEHQLSDFLEGNGTPDEPYLISTAEQFNLIGLFVCEWDNHFQLVNDINIAQYSGTELNLIGNPCHPFSGVFDGNEHTIQNFTWTSAERDYIGLFRYLDKAGQIKNLAMENVDVNAANAEFVGSLVGANGGTISNCHSTGTILGYGVVGGLLGANWGTINTCYSKGTVTGDRSVAGLVGTNDSGTIISCYSSSTVSGRVYVAGLVAYMWRWPGAVINCYATGNITGEKWVGGLVAYNDEDATINACYSTGNVDGDEFVGGLVGKNWWATITSCYSTGSVSGNERIGGLVGFNYESTVMASFWDIETSGQTSSAGGTGLLTPEMQMASTFTGAGWDFVGERINGSEDIWMMTCEGMSYPKLSWWQPVLGDYFCPDGVDMIDMEHLALHWLDTGCDETNDYCDWAEISNDSTIDFTDFAILAGNWLAGR